MFSNNYSFKFVFFISNFSFSHLLYHLCLILANCSLFLLHFFIQLGFRFQLIFLLFCRSNLNFIFLAVFYSLLVFYFLNDGLAFFFLCIRTSSSFVVFAIQKTCNALYNIFLFLDLTLFLQIIFHLIFGLIMRHCSLNNYIHLEILCRMNWMILCSLALSLRVVLHLC